MKKVFMAVLLVVTMILSGCGSEKPSESEKSKEKVTIGVITHLNASETEYNALMQKLEASYRPSKANLSANYKYFDKMSDMQLALESGQINMLSTYQSVADYMIQYSSDKEILQSERNLQDSFCFAVREDDTTLKNDFNKAIESMIADGTLARLSKEYIIDVREGTEPPIVPIEEISGAETIKVAVTGDLPPFDMVLANGKPAGFSTAVLSEISKRINKNIEIFDIDSNARASILTSKGADVIFWVAVPEDSTIIPENVDKPEGIAITEPYYQDKIVHVGLKK